jgi:hypothetical protein
VTRRQVLAALVAVTGAACDGSVPGPTPPRLVLEPVQFDFGAVRPGSNLTRRIRVRNAGGEPLHIIKVDSSCDCLVGSPEKEVVPPGGAVDLNVTLRISERTGPVVRTVTVRTNDPARPAQTVELRATVAG